MELKLTLQPDSLQIGAKIKQNMDKAGEQVREAMRGAAHDAAQEIDARGADDIEEAGNFGSRWQDALQSTVKETQRTFTVETRMVGEPPVSYWRVFEYGADISAKNPSGYMWLPFAGTEGTDVWPSAYSGELFRTESRKGTPLLGDKDTKEWKYFGVPEVHIPQKFHLRQIIAQVARELRTYYADRMKG